MATIKQLMIIAEIQLNEASSKVREHSLYYIENEVAISQAASLLAIARSLNHIIDHGVGPAPLQMLSDEEREALTPARPSSMLGNERLE